MASHTHFNYTFVGREIQIQDQNIFSIKPWRTYEITLPRQPTSTDVRIVAKKTSIKYPEANGFVTISFECCPLQMTDDSPDGYNMTYIDADGLHMTVQVGQSTRKFIMDWAGDLQITIRLRYDDGYYNTRLFKHQVSAAHIKGTEDGPGYSLVPYWYFPSHDIRCMQRKEEKCGHKIHLTCGNETIMDWREVTDSDWEQFQASLLPVT